MSYSVPNISPNVIEVLLKLYNTNEDHLLDVLATSPKTSVLRVNLCHPDANEAVCHLRKYLDSLPRKGAGYEVTRHSVFNDVLLVSCGSEDSTQPPVDKEVMVDTSCGSAVLRGADIFAPGVLAAHPGMKKDDMVSVYVDLERKCRRGLAKKFDGEKYFLGNGIALYSRQQLFENNTNLKGTAIQMTSCRNQHPSFSGLDTSLFFPQNLPSILVGHVLNPQKDDTVLDMCGSPGGKTTHVATLLQNTGTVISIDKTEKKVNRINTNCSDLGLSNVKTFCFDSTNLLSKDTSAATQTQGPPFAAESFSKILLDPPCSGLGQRPQLRYVMSTKELNSYPVYQRKLLKQAVGLLKPGGCLVYSTCTLLPEENEEQVAWVLENFPQMRLSHQIPVLGRHGLNGYGLSSSDCEQVQRFDWFYLQLTERTVPQDTFNKIDVDICGASRYDTIGFFIAKFIKMDNFG